MRLLLFVFAASACGQEWKSLFDGRTFEGWDKRNNLWVIEDGAISTNPAQTFSRGDLLTRESYRNFELEFEWKVARAANAGVKYRLQGSFDFRSGVTDPQSSNDILLGPDFQGPKAVSVVGFEYQLADDENTPDSRRGAKWAAGALYQYAPAVKKSAARGEVFHKARLVVRDMKVEHWLDGERVVDVDLEMPGLIWSTPGTYRAALTGMLLAQRKLESPIALQYHHTKAWYKGLRIRRLP